jgi:hypothetical protein
VQLPPKVARLQLPVLVTVYVPLPQFLMSPPVALECIDVEGAPTHSAPLFPKCPKAFEKGEDSDVHIGEGRKELCPPAQNLSNVSISLKTELSNPYPLSFFGGPLLLESIAVPRWVVPLSMALDYLPH